MRPIILASASAARAAVLKAAGVTFKVSPSRVDEAVLKTGRLAAGAGVRTVAQDLADAKARDGAHDGEALIIGADQTLELDGQLLDKTRTLAEARERLIRLRGRAFMLHCALAGVSGAQIVWRHCETARLTMRDFSDDYLDAYLARNGAELAASLAGFALESEGAQLLARIEGDYFAILGLPLLPLLDWLRRDGGLAR